MDHHVALAPLYSILNEIALDLAEVLIGGALAWLAYYVHRYAPPVVRAFLDAKASTVLNATLQNGVAIALHRLEGWESVHTDIAVKSAVTSWATNYALGHASGAIDHFGLSPSQLALKAEAYLPKPPALVDLPSGNIVAIGSASPAGQTDAEERAETAALNRARASKDGKII